MADEVNKVDTGAKKVWPRFMGWVGSASALIGLFASLAGGVAWILSHHHQNAERQAKMALAEAQARQGEYEASIQSYGDILKADSSYRPALDEQLNTAMLWAEDLHAIATESQSSAAVAARELDEIMPILDAGLTRSKGSEAGDVEAHIGWAHWLNQRMAEREFDSAAEKDLRAALALDPSNVYAHAMLGGWMLQTHGDFDEAIHHLDLAIATGRARPFVRAMQLGGLRYLDKPGARAAQVKAANDMRKGGEPLDETYKRGIISFCFDAAVADHGELTESLSAVPPEEAWKTYLWLDNNAAGKYGRNLMHDFIDANLLEVSGKHDEALAKFRELQQKLRDAPGSMKNSVDAGVKRLSQG